MAAVIEADGKSVASDARRRFVAYGGRKLRVVFQHSASGIESASGVLADRGGAYASVGQTLPRAEIVQRRRPDSSLLLYEKALGPALESRRDVVNRGIESAPESELRRHG